MAAEPSSTRFRRLVGLIAIGSVAGIVLHLFIRFVFPISGLIFGAQVRDLPLLAVLLFCGGPLLANLAWRFLRAEFGSDLLAGIAIVTSIILGEYLAGVVVVVMLSGGAALEAYAVRSASSVLAALAKRMPSVAHRKSADRMESIALNDVVIGDTLVILPHEICPVDGTVVAGHGSMDESYLTGEPYVMSKAPGSAVLSGAINGESALTIHADRRAVDSRYAMIMRVMRDSEQRRPRLRRLGDQLGALYTPVAVAIAAAAWAISGDSLRFLAVLVVATPCPLLIAIPVAIIGAVSLAARRGIIIRDPAVMEKIDTCRVAIFDKTGTLTYGQPKLIEILAVGDFHQQDVLAMTASLEQYSKHPLAGAVLEAFSRSALPLQVVTEVSEKPGQGLSGRVAGKTVRVTGRPKLMLARPELVAALPPEASGLECIVLIDELLAGVLRFRDQPRREGEPFVRHLAPKHHFERVMLVSGDRETEVRYLADLVGITEVFAGQSPEQKLQLVRAETARANTVFLGDGINDAPALTAATVGIAFGQNSDITAEAAGAVIMESSLAKVDEFLHIGGRLRSIALQSALGGLLLSIGGMFLAAFGYLPPVAGAVTQEVIDLLAVLNALRMARMPNSLTDF